MVRKWSEPGHSPSAACLGARERNARSPGGQRVPVPIRTGTRHDAPFGFRQRRPARRDPRPIRNGPFRSAPTGPRTRPSAASGWMFSGLRRNSSSRTIPAPRGTHLGARAGIYVIPGRIPPATRPDGRSPEFPSVAFAPKGPDHEELRPSILVRTRTAPPERSSRHNRKPRSGPDTPQPCAGKATFRPTGGDRTDAPSEHDPGSRHFPDQVRPRFQREPHSEFPGSWT